MKKFRYKIYITLAVAWMIIIFLNSSIQGDTSGGISAAIISFMVKILQTFGDSRIISNAISVIKSDWFHLFLRKTAHFVEFAILEILYLASLGVFNRMRDSYKMRFFIAIGMAIIYAVTDEIHQLFVAGRVGAVGDVLIDAFGALFGAGFLAIIIHLKRKKLGKVKIIEN